VSADGGNLVLGGKLTEVTCETTLSPVSHKSKKDLDENLASRRRRLHPLSRASPNSPSIRLRLAVIQAGFKFESLLLARAISLAGPSGTLTMPAPTFVTANRRRVRE